MKYAYYPGCSLHSTGIEYDISTRLVAQKLGIELEELDDWNCCGATAAHTTSHLLGLALPARNLAIAEKAGLDVVAPCASCYNRMKTTELAVKSSVETKDKIAQVTEMQYEGKVGVKSALEALVREPGPERIKSLATQSLSGLKVASYYGCLLVRPKNVAIDDNEDPVLMDDLVTTLGGEAIQWPGKTECCGATLPTARGEVGIQMVTNLLQMAQTAGAEAIVCACPLCFVNLDMRQSEIQNKIPIFYFTELMGIAFGEQPAKVGADKHFVDPQPVLAKYNLK